MNLLITLLPQELPVFARGLILNELLAATAEAFECPMPALDHRSYDARLRSYALFTREQAGKALQGGREIPALKARLYECAYPLGVNLRNWFRVKTVEEVMALGQILYRAVGVEVEGSTGGDLVVKRCTYSPFYSPAVCDLISAMDDGVFSGLSGGRLAFTQRLTEGRDCCRAKLQFEEHA